jgi:drug/metabolite transporter (DMT)-like permease
LISQDSGVFAVALAALSALVWGSADFCGGKATRRGGALAVTVVSQIFGLPTLLVCVLLLPGTPTGSDLAWGAAAGAAGLAGIVLLYKGLASGRMAVVAPITAVTGALIPMITGLLLDRAPGALALVGAACAVVAIAMVSLSPSDRGAAPVGARLIGLALASGAMFGLFFALLGQTGEGSGMWPLVGVRACSITLGLLVMVRRGMSVRVPRTVLPWVVAAGAGDIAANALYLVAVQDGLMSVIAPIAALYPVSTVLLALAVDKERVRPVQWAGLAFAAGALVLTAV